MGSVGFVRLTTTVNVVFFNDSHRAKAISPSLSRRSIGNSFVDSAEVKKRGMGIVRLIVREG